MWVRSLGWKDPLEDQMATYSSILAWKIPWTEKPGKLQSLNKHTQGTSWCLAGPGETPLGAG